MLEIQDRRQIKNTDIKRTKQTSEKVRNATQQN